MITGPQFCAWLAAMKAAGLARTDADCAALLDVSANTVVTLKKNGGDRRTELSCSALYAQLDKLTPPWVTLPRA